jgi:phosphoribosylformylglycinamidine synthase
VLLGECTDELGASEYLAWIHGQTVGAPPACDPVVERAVIEVLLEAIDDGLVRSAHDCSEGGLAVAVAESAMMDRESPFGVRLSLADQPGVRPRALLFGEAQARIVVSTPDPAGLLAVAHRAGVRAAVIGEVGEPGGTFSLTVGEETVSCPVGVLAEAYHEAIPRIMSQVASASDDAVAAATVGAS